MEKADELKQQGVSDIICTSVNDPFVMNAWGKQQNTCEYFSILFFDAFGADAYDFEYFFFQLVKFVF